MATKNDIKNREGRTAVPKCPQCGKDLVATRFVGQKNQMLWMCGCGFAKTTRELAGSSKPPGVAI